MRSLSTTLVELETEIEQLKGQRLAIDAKIGRLEALVVELKHTQASMRQRQSGPPARSSITDAIRTFLRDSAKPATLGCIRGALPGFGIDVSAYRQPVPTIATTVNRLVKRGEVRKLYTGGNTGTMYLYVSFHGPETKPTNQPEIRCSGEFLQKRFVQAWREDARATINLPNQSRSTNDATQGET